MILHIMMDEKFTIPFIEFFNEEFKELNNLFLVMCSKEEKRYVDGVELHRDVVVVRKNIIGLIKIISYMITSKKIVLHGMFSPYIMLLLWMLRVEPKVYWCIWGGDLYDYPKESVLLYKLKRRLISRFRALVTPLETDYFLAKKTYGANGKWFPALGPNTIILEKREDIFFLNKVKNSTKNVLLGNSADCENRHVFMIDKIKEHVKNEMNVYIPLSYGDRMYAQEISNYACKIMKNNAIPMLDFIPLEQYKEFLATVDIAMFAHKRQQAFSNIIQMLALGVKVYIEPHGAIWDFLHNLGVKIYDINHVEEDLLDLLSVEEMIQNRNKICERCSKKIMYEEWKAIFEDRE